MPGREFVIQCLSGRQAGDPELSFAGSELVHCPIALCEGAHFGPPPARRFAGFPRTLRADSIVMLARRVESVQVIDTFESFFEK
jgi:hypothetical protein